jgi:hypothetical protein
LEFLITESSLFLESIRNALISLGSLRTQERFAGVLPYRLDFQTREGLTSVGSTDVNAVNAFGVDQSRENAAFNTSNLATSERLHRKSKYN